MAVDLSVFGKSKTIADFQREEEAFNLNKRMQQAQILKAQQLDIDAMGEQAFYKAAQGLELTPQERAAAAVVDAKSGGIMYDPVTGQATQKPRISDKISIGGNDGLDGMFPTQGGGRTAPPMAPNGQNPYVGAGNPATTQGYGDIIPSISEADLDGGIPSAPKMPVGVGKVPIKNQFDISYEQSMRAAAGNPKLQQTLTEKYYKDKGDFTEGQALSAGYADRMILDQQTFTDPTISEKANRLDQKLLYELPEWLGRNYLISDEKQAYEQAKGDYGAAQLRKESGATIAPSETAALNINDFPSAGDSQETLDRKAATRNAKISAMQRGAGAAYTPPDIQEYAPSKKMLDIPMTAVNLLRKNPQTANQFDAKYGKGASKTVLGGK